MTLGQEICEDFRRRYLPYEPPRDRVVIREERAFCAIDGDRIIYGITRRTEERINA